MKHIGILVVDGVEVLDAVGPCEVLAWWTLNFPEDGYHVSFVSRSGEPVEAAKGLTLAPHSSTTDSPPLDVFRRPGGQGTRPLLRCEEHLGWVRELASQTPLMASVCTGSLVYAAAGLLRNRPATAGQLRRLLAYLPLHLRSISVVTSAHDSGTPAPQHRRALR